MNDAAGDKMSNLVFVVVRQFEEGPMYWYVDNFAHETPCDSLYHREAMKLLLKRKDIFDGVKTLWISGDHGPHFWSYETLFWQSTLWELTKDIFGCLDFFTIA
jgi:hypothetical protein